MGDLVEECAAGSSPRARGALRCGEPRHPSRGIIPACAGSTRGSTRWPTGGRDHPRVRGEHIRASTSASCCSGSSPRARGALLIGMNPLFRGGSSPRARGAPHPAPKQPQSRGIIPACAGSTAGTLAAPRPTGDHPRVRGEHVVQYLIPEAAQGSSPRARGALDLLEADGHLAGIIPACAGSTQGDPRQDPGRQDHPRVRGEHRGQEPHRLRVQGSSPRARGAHDPR